MNVDEDKQGDLVLETYEKDFNSSLPCSQLDKTDKTEKKEKKQRKEIVPAIILFAYEDYKISKRINKSGIEIIRREAQCSQCIKIGPDLVRF